MIARYSSILAVAAAFSAAFGLTPARAAVLTYDTPIINLNSGDSVTIGATLFAPGLKTNKFGQIIPTACAHCTSRIYVDAEQLNMFSYPLNEDPNFLITHYAKFVTDSPNPVGNLDGSDSTHLILGELKTNPSLPSGTYFLNIGIYEENNNIGCPPPPPGSVYSCLIMINFDPSPNFADAGFLTINVSRTTAAVPEPATLAFFAMGLAGFAVMRRRAMV